MRNIATTLALLVLPLAATAQPVIDGNLNDSQYAVLATGGAGTGFGTAIDVTSIRYYVDTATSMLYIGVTGKLDQGSNNGIGLWIGASGTGSSTGVAAGSPLGVNGNGNGHYLNGDNGNNANFRADFEVDYMFAVNPGSSANAYLNAARRWGGTAGTYIGNSAGVNGTSAAGTGPVGGSITFAVNNGGGATQGLEIRMPLSEIGATTASAITAFAMVVSNSAFFSDDTVPGFPGTPPGAPDKGLDAPAPSGIRANPGFNPNFGTLPGGPFNTGSTSLPVELVSFSGLGTARVRVWRGRRRARPTTPASPSSSRHGDAWTERGFVAGRGTTTERSDYAFDVNGLTAGHATPSACARPTPTARCTTRPSRRSRWAWTALRCE